MAVAVAGSLGFTTMMSVSVTPLGKVLTMVMKREDSFDCPWTTTTFDLEESVAVTTSFDSLGCTTMTLGLPCSVTVMTSVDALFGMSMTTTLGLAD